jgi:hypothetical protein
MGGFERRTPADMAVIPMRHDVATAALAAAISSTAVAPFLMCVDRAVVAAAAGTAPGGSLFRAIAGVAGEFVAKPKVAFAQPALWMVAGVYGGTYFAKNVSDVCIERNDLPSDHKAANAGKFLATTACNMGGSILKDAAFAKMYGAGAGAASVVRVPPASYALFALRDCLTIGGAFVVPDAMSAGLLALTSVHEKTAGIVSQLLSPPLMQVACTPMHLFSLSLINDPGATIAARIARLQTATPAALLARSLRMLPAYGVGGILNAKLVAEGRALAKRRARRRGDDRGGGANGVGFGGKAVSAEKPSRESNRAGPAKSSQTSTRRGAGSSEDLDEDRARAAEETLAGGWFLGEGFFSGNAEAEGGFERIALGVGLRSPLALGTASSLSNSSSVEERATRPRGVRGSGTRVSGTHARVMRVSPPRFAALTLADAAGAAAAALKTNQPLPSGADSNETTLFSTTKESAARFGDRFRARSRRSEGHRTGRRGVWRPGRCADVAAAAVG